MGKLLSGGDGFLGSHLKIDLVTADGEKDGKIVIEQNVHAEEIFKVTYFQKIK